MCRIAGILHTAEPLERLTLQVKEMCDAQQHGGPDDEGLYTDAAAHLVLGNRRLSLLDLTAAGHMPMQYADRYVITYNGEIYNYAALKAELEAAGYRFSNHTDTEVILAAFARWNTQAFARFNGMFAFALWDKLTQQLYLVRDAAGIKPLYYSCKAGRLSFASEMRSFKKLGFAEHESWKIFLLAYGHLPEPVTNLQDVQPLPKGCFLQYDSHTQKARLQSFSFFSFSNGIIDSQRAVGHLQQLLADSVQRQLLADAPVGIFLSGGLDSSILTALASKSKAGSIKTLSLYFEDKQLSEKYYQDLVIRHLQSANHQFLVQEQDFQQQLPQVLDGMDLPSCDGINTWFISRFARQQGLKAVLSGIGGDELFGGYPSFKRMALAEALQQLPRAALKAANKTGGRYQRFSYLRLQGIQGIYLFLRGHFSMLEIARQLDATEKEVYDVLATPPPVDFINLHGKNKASWMEFNLYMQNQLLRDADVMGMQNSLEIRVPFLDETVIRHAFATQSSIKYGAMPKQMLVDAFGSLLPKEVYDRKKMGFTFPFDQWLSRNAYVRQLLESGSPQDKALFRKFENGQVPWYKLLSLVHIRRSRQALSN